MVDEERLMEKLDQINRNLLKLTALVSLSGKDDKEKARILSKMGFSSFEIEGMTGVPASTVRAQRRK
jgi:hypothetical protein